jgi:hypothetical protein
MRAPCVSGTVSPSDALLWRVNHKRQRASRKEMTMPALILWLLGVPLSVIILLYLIF